MASVQDLAVKENDVQPTLPGEPTRENSTSSEAKELQADVNYSIDPENEVTGVNLLLVHISLCICTFLIGLDFNAIATASPVITSKFQSIQDVGWCGSAFYMTLCASLPLAGKTYTLFPKPITYILYLFIFELGSLVCGVAQSSGALIAGRAVAGFGASGVFAGGFVILTTIIPLHKRALYTGTMSSTFAIASIVGPLIGGGLTQHASWRWCFYINLPIGRFATLVVLAFLRVKPAATENVSLVEKMKGLDFIGFALFASSITMLLLALQRGADGIHYGWKSSEVIDLFIGAGLVFPIFIGWQIYMQNTALIPPRLFDNRNVGLICASSFLVNGSFQTIVYWLPIWFQAILGASPTGSGVRYLPTVISGVLASLIGAGMVMQIGIWNPFLLFAEVMVCICGGLLTTLHPGISQAKWIGYLIFGGIGYSLASNIAHLGMQASLPMDLVPLGATNLLMIISTSCAIFLSIGQLVFEERLTTNLSGVVPANVVDRLLEGGVNSIRQVVNGMDLPAVVRAYSDSTTQVFWIPAIAPIISFLLVAGCKWTVIKKQEAKRVENSKDNVDEKVEG